MGGSEPTSKQVDDLELIHVSTVGDWDEYHFAAAGKYLPMVVQVSPGEKPVIHFFQNEEESSTSISFRAFAELLLELITKIDVK